MYVDKEDDNKMGDVMRLMTKPRMSLLMMLVTIMRSVLMTMSMRRLGVDDDVDEDNDEDYKDDEL